MSECGCKQKKKKAKVKECSCGKQKYDGGNVSFSTSQIITPGASRGKPTETRYSAAEQQPKRNKVRSLSDLIEQKMHGVTKEQVMGKQGKAKA